MIPEHQYHDPDIPRWAIVLATLVIVVLVASMIAMGGLAGQ